jgi:hypothetical protein
MIFDVIKLLLGPPPQPQQATAANKLLRIFGEGVLIRRENLDGFKQAALADKMHAYRIYDTGHPLVVVVTTGHWCDRHARFHFPNER